MTNAEYVNTVWQCLEKTSFLFAAYRMMADMLKDVALLKEKARKLHKNAKAAEYTKSFYKVCNPNDLSYNALRLADGESSQIKRDKKMVSSS